MLSLFRMLRNPETLVCSVRITNSLLLPVLSILLFGWKPVLLLLSLAWALNTFAYYSLQNLLSRSTRVVSTIGIDMVLTSLFVYMGGGFETDLYALYYWVVAETCFLIGWSAGLLVTLMSNVIYFGIAMMITPDLSYARLFTRLLLFTAETLPLLYIIHLEQIRKKQNLEKDRLLQEKERLVRELETITQDLSRYTFDVQDRAVLDQLTQLYNQTHFHDRLMVEVEKARQEGSSLSLALFDIDNFKSFNDTYGHQCGDEVLRAVGKAIAEATEKTDFITARIGGEEIAIIIPYQDSESGYRFADQVCKRIAELVVPHDDLSHLQVTVSGGVATFPTHAVDGRTLIRYADQAMYAAKAQGKNRVVSFESMKLEV